MKWTGYCFEPLEGERDGTFACPKCGAETQHGHSPEFLKREDFWRPIFEETITKNNSRLWDAGIPLDKMFPTDRKYLERRQPGEGEQFGGYLNPRVCYLWMFFMSVGHAVEDSLPRMTHVLD